MKSGSKPQPVINSKRQDSNGFAISSEHQSAEANRVLHQVEKILPELRGNAYDRGLQGLLRLAAGNRVDYRSPLYVKGYKDKKPIMPPRTEIVAMLDAEIKAYKVGDVLEEVLDSIENEEREAIGPQSMFLPWSEDGPAKAAAVYSDKPLPKNFDRKAWDRALDRLEALVATQSIGMISIEEAVHGEGTVEDDELANDGMDTDTNSGMPWNMSGWKPKPTDSRAKREEKERVFKYVMDKARVITSELKTKVTKLPLFVAVSFQRLVQKGPKPYGPKAKRLVIGCPKEMVVAGNTADKPITNAFKDIKSPAGDYLFPAFRSLPEIDARAQRMLRRAAASGTTVVSGDISGMDSSLIPLLFSEVGHRIARWVRGGEIFESQMFDAMIYSTSLVTPTKYYKEQPSSNKSGSSPTTLGNCGYLTAAIFYGEERGYYKIVDLMVHGDDSCGCGPGYTPETFSQALEEVGLTSNPDKQFYKPGFLHYLQRLHAADRPGGIYPVYRALGHALSLERFEFKPGDWTGLTYSVRMLAQVNNCAFNPYISAVLNVLANGDKFELGRKFTNPSDMLADSGSVGHMIARTGSTDSVDWRRMDKAMSFDSWLPNGLLRGETPPPPGLDLFRRVYGERAVLI